MNVDAIVVACLVAALLALTMGAALGWAAAHTHDRIDSLVTRIDALLPQTQCGQCLYPGCRPYATAIARGDADIDRCPPGGAATVRALAQLLDREPRPVDPAYGVTKDAMIAWIDEDRCIGCARCLPPCPVDAIVGAPRYLHTVISAQCTGCELCIPACPVDCIELRPLGSELPVRRNRAA